MINSCGYGGREAAVKHDAATIMLHPGFGHLFGDKHTFLNSSSTHRVPYLSDVPAAPVMLL